MLPNSANKVLLVGWDSADWQLLRPLLKSGRLPTLAKLIADGCWGNLASLDPMLSPMIWTSIATGKYPHQHRVLGFVEPEPRTGGLRPVGSHTRQGPALWNILTEAGIKAHVVGWYASHPAEKISGVCLSERFPLPVAPPSEPWPMLPGVVEPASRAAELAACRVHPRAITAEQVQYFIPQAAQLDQSDPEVQQKLEELAVILAEAGSIHSAAVRILEREKWDFLGVYYRALDSFGHQFMPFHPPAVHGVRPQDTALYGPIMARACEFHDLMLAHLLQVAGEGVTVILVSDHGFHCGQGRPGPVANDTKTMADWHRHFGIAAMAGPHLRRGEQIFGSVVMDVTPTVLQLFGLPVAEDMGGKVLATAWETPPEIRRIPTYDTEAGAAKAPLEPDPISTRAAMGQLVALGYLDEASLANSEKFHQVVFEIESNRITSNLYAHRFVEAERLARQLVAQYPNERRAFFRLCQALVRQGRLEEARALLEEMVKRLGSCTNTERVLARLSLRLARPEEALAELDRAAKEEPLSAGLQLQIGNIHAQRRDWRQAELHYTRAVNLNSEDAEAWRGLAQALVRQGRDREAAGSALTAVGLLHHFPAGHFQLGAILSKLKFYPQAIQAFETVLSMQPAHALAHRYLRRLRPLAEKRQPTLEELDDNASPEVILP